MEETTSSPLVSHDTVNVIRVWSDSFNHELACCLVWSSQKPPVKPLQGPPVYTSSAAYMGSGVPSSMYLSASPYGSSLFNGASVPPYDLPFSGGSGYPYDCGNRLSVGSPYGPLHLSGGIYGMSPMMDRYGLGLPLGHVPMGARPGAFPNENPQKKASGMRGFSCFNTPFTLAFTANVY
ncbi:hypothetical protein ACLOJK_037011 [Asimina triloba]